MDTSSTTQVGSAKRISSTTWEAVCCPRRRQGQTVVGQDNGSTLERREAAGVARRICELLQHMVAESIFAGAQRVGPKGEVGCWAMRRSEHADVPGGWQSRSAGHLGQRALAAAGTRNAARCGCSGQRKRAGAKCLGGRELSGKTRGERGAARIKCECAQQRTNSSVSSGGSRNWKPFLVYWQAMCRLPRRAHGPARGWAAAGSRGADSCCIPSTGFRGVELDVHIRKQVVLELSFGHDFKALLLGAAARMWCHWADW